VLRRRDDRYRQASPTGEDAHLVIEVAFDTVTLILVPALEALQGEQLLKGAFQSEMSGEAMRHRAAMDRVRAGAERATDQATACARAKRAA
jgi:hypothetical protein